MRSLVLAIGGALLPIAASAQQPIVHRLPSDDILDVTPPSVWVEGVPGQMNVLPPGAASVTARSC